MNKVWEVNSGIQFEIFLHKIDGMSEDYRLGKFCHPPSTLALKLTDGIGFDFLDTLQNLRDRLTEELFDISPELESSMNVFYHLTSVFDTSIYEALSRVVQKLIPEQAMLERLLDLLCQVSLFSFLSLLVSSSTHTLTLTTKSALHSNVPWTKHSSLTRHPKSTSRPILPLSTIQRTSSVRTTST